MKRINLGSSDFKEVIDNNFYFVDKTLIVKEFLEDCGKIVLLPRPRRFGKTLNISIIKYFLEKSKEDKAYLFKGLNIEKESSIMNKQGDFPVIYITFKDDKHKTYNAFINIMKNKMSDVYESFDFIYESLSQKDKRYFDSIVNSEASEDLLEISLLKLSSYLSKYYNQKVIILIDEYDTPIYHGYYKNYYDEIIGFMRNFLSSALKDNINLEKAMITGILRVAKESIFSGLNNLKVYSLINEEYSKMFGFTEEEVNNILIDFNCNDETASFKKWYNGYIFGSETIYNPWSVLYYLSEKRKEFKPYWVNTSENLIINNLLAKGDYKTKIDLEKLHNMEPIKVILNEEITMNKLGTNPSNVWSFLLMCGYLKVIGKETIKGKVHHILATPNEEIRTLFESIITEWFLENPETIDASFDDMLNALVTGDIKNFSKVFKGYVLSTFSFFDVGGKNPERVYHAFVLGMLVSLSHSHEVLSNRESGLGRYDVCIVPKDISKLGIIIEFKRYDEEDEETIEETQDIALAQIEEKKYDTELKTRGIKEIIKLAIIFNGKEVHIKRS